ncbi:MAG: hypothetical protein UHE93_07255 [Muribaculaceae bacterium]|nr:hypothetical protein [Muribaculaceae bacterium]
MKNTEAGFVFLARLLYLCSSDNGCFDSQRVANICSVIIVIPKKKYRDDGFDGDGEMDDGAAGGACRRLGGVWR